MKPFLRHRLCDRHRRVRLDPLCHILASRLRHAAIQSLRSPQGAFFLLYYYIHDHHLHHRWCSMVTKAVIVLIIISFLKWSWLMIKTATRWCKNIKIFTRWCKNIEIFTRWCKNMREPWYSDSVVSYLEEQRALVGVLHKDNYLGSFYSIHIFTKGQKCSHTTRMSRSIWFQEYSLCCRASRLTKRSTWGQSPSEFHLKRWAF